jgi:hypothetical protein
VVGEMKKIFRYAVSCAPFYGSIMIKMDDSLPEHARQKIAMSKAQITHDKHCPDKTKHTFRVQHVGTEEIH